MAKYTIVETRKIRSTNPANASGFDTLVTFTNEAQRLDVVTVDGDAPTPDDIKAAISAHVAHRDKHMGTQLEI